MFAKIQDGSYDYVIVIEFTKPPKFTEHHQAGLDAAAAGDFTQAQDAFYQAHELLVQEAVGESFQLHEARVGRDLGFLHVREEASLDPGDTRKNPSLVVAQSTAALESCRVSTDELLDLGADTFTPNSWQLLNAEHGATIMFQARTALFGALSSGEDLIEAEAMEAAHELFKDAETFLNRGGNAYYGASNAIRSAAAERLAGRPLAALRLSVDASVYPLATLNSVSDTKASALTVGANGWRLVSKALVAKGILKKP